MTSRVRMFFGDSWNEKECARIRHRMTTYLPFLAMVGMVVVDGAGFLLKAAIGKSLSRRDTAPNGCFGCSHWVLPRSARPFYQRGMWLLVLRRGVSRLNANRHSPMRSCVCRGLGWWTVLTCVGHRGDDCGQSEKAAALTESSV